VVGLGLRPRGERGPLERACIIDDSLRRFARPLMISRHLAFTEPWESWYSIDDGGTGLPDTSREQRTGGEVETLQLMKKAPLFDGVGERILRMISQRCVVKSYDPGEAILNETEPSSGLSVVLEGRVKLSKISQEGREQTLTVLAAGDPFGLCTAFASNDFPANVVLERSTILTIPGSLLQETAREEPLLLLNVIRILSGRLRETMDLVENIALKDLPQRIASFLLHEAAKKSCTQGCTIDIGMSHRELAKIVGATPEALSRALRRMSDEGVLKVEGRVIRLIDLEALKGLSGG